MAPRRSRAVRPAPEGFGSLVEAPPSSPFGFIGDPNVQLTCGSTQLNIVQKVHVAPLLYGRVWLVCHKWPHALVAGSVGGAWFAERWG